MTDGKRIAGSSYTRAKVRRETKRSLAATAPSSNTDSRDGPCVSSRAHAVMYGTLASLSWMTRPMTPERPPRLVAVVTALSWFFGFDPSASALNLGQQLSAYQLRRL